MATIIVRVSEHTYTYEEATKWEVDSDGYLAILTDSGVLGLHRYWDAVYLDPGPKRNYESAF